MPKKPFYLRLDEGLRESAEQAVAESKGQYRSLAHFIELAIREKVEREGKEQR